MPLDGTRTGIQHLHLALLDASVRWHDNHYTFMSFRSRHAVDGTKNRNPETPCWIPAFARMTYFFCYTQTETRSIVASVMRQSSDRETLRQTGSSGEDSSRKIRNHILRRGASTMSRRFVLRTPALSFFKTSSRILLPICQ